MSRPSTGASQPDHSDDSVVTLARPENLTLIVGENLRRIRTRNGLSLERLAKASGVSRGMLGQIELGRSTPTITVLWKIARALDVPLSAFTAADGQGCGSVTVLRADRALWLTTTDRRLSIRALFPSGEVRREEFREIRLLAHSRCTLDPMPPGTTKNLVVAKGRLDILIAGGNHRLDSGDAIFFEADRPHDYNNPANVEAVLYQVAIYPDPRTLGPDP